MRIFRKGHILLRAFGQAIGIAQEAGKLCILLRINCYKGTSGEVQ